MKFLIDHLGKGIYANPLASTMGRKFVDDDDHILLNPQFSVTQQNFATDLSFELAGPRSKIYFNPSSVKAAVVTCGGLCPGINSVIRSLVVHLWERYGCREIYGIPYGYQGLARDNHQSWFPLDPESVAGIHRLGGSMLGSSRGTPPTDEIIDSLKQKGINMLFVIGGDGTLRGAHAIHEKVQAQGLKLAVVAIPKTIDNDISYVRRSFGFETAVEKACESIEAAFIEASGVRCGIGLVKLMGRNSGYIAAYASLATGHVDLCLVPEVSFKLQGKNNLFSQIEHILSTKNVAVIVVAEGSGQEHFGQDQHSYDASGNLLLNDIGVYLKNEINTYFKTRTLHPTLKYIDPSYLIRAAQPNTSDQNFCNRLGQNAAHAAMAGKTGLLIGFWHGRMTHVPLKEATGRRQQIDPSGDLWFSVLETTGQAAALT